jgi:hypothetical protein
MASGGSGPRVARLFHALLALVFVDAWLSLGVQLQVLVGSRGLMPAAPWLAEARRQGLSFFELPTLFWWHAGDRTLTVGVWLGVALALAALAGVRPRLLLGLSTALYLSYATLARTFLSFQWDNLLLECGAFAVLLPRHRRARWIHVLYRLILFKLYFESGIAKWQSHLGDWRDGSAMTYYYETAPLPAAGAWFFHALPVWWHHLESWATLGFELVLPFAIFGGRRLRLAALFGFTFFQIVNAATANYGFFCYLALVLSVFLLDDADIERLRGWLRRRRSESAPPEPAALGWPRARRAGVIGAAGLFGVVSLVEAAVHFGPEGAWRARVQPLRELYEPWRLINTYHLFGSITRERIEPEFQVSDGKSWTALELWHKPGDLGRRPDYVAPHQPRVDFQLWFYGLAYRRTPFYVATLLERLCDDPQAVAGLFRAPPPPHAEAVRLLYWRYHFTTRDERQKSGDWWRREPVNETKPISCAGADEHVHAD